MYNLKLQRVGTGGSLIWSKLYRKSFWSGRPKL